MAEMWRVGTPYSLHQMEREDAILFQKINRETMTEPKNTDLSKLKWSRLKLPEWSGRGSVGCVLRGDSLSLECGWTPFASFDGLVWFYSPATWSRLEVAKTYTDRVDRFIVEESARIAEPMGQPRQPCCATCGVTDCHAPSSPVDCGRYVREKKPEPRPCTREFALSHPAESEYRFKGSAATEWHQWQPMSDFMYGTVQYEFRTTAPEEKRETVEFDYEHSVNRCLRIEDGPHTISAIIPPSEMTAGKWHIVATMVK